MDQLKKVFFVSFFISQFTLAIALDLSKINFSYQYDAEGAMSYSYRISEDESSYTIYYRIKKDPTIQWQQAILNQADYRSPQHDSLTVALDTLFESEEALDLRFSVSKSVQKILLISFYDLDKGVYRIIDISLSSPVGFPSFIPINQEGRPILRKYITTNFLATNTAGGSVQAYRYLEDFEESDPPMGSMKPLAPSLTIDSTFSFQASLSGLKDYHFYLLQDDSLANNGVTMLKCPAYYPEFKRLEELIGPLVYITTQNEIKSLRDQGTKKVFEQFWINTYGTKFRAKSAIKFYYDRVEEANKLFTDYKQGWKTDRGMLYIIYGQPTQVIKSQNTEVWKYNEDIQFEFIKISTLFTSELYTLKRDRKYEKMWYNQVGNIRKGI